MCHAYPDPNEFLDQLGDTVVSDTLSEIANRHLEPHMEYPVRLTPYSAVWEFSNMATDITSSPKLMAKLKEGLTAMGFHFVSFQTNGFHYELRRVVTDD